MVVALDDVQWLDSASAGVLEVAFRRLRDERVGLLVTLRSDTGPPLALERMLPLGFGPELADFGGLAVRRGIGVVGLVVIVVTTASASAATPAARFVTPRGATLRPPANGRLKIPGARITCSRGGSACQVIALLRARLASTSRARAAAPVLTVARTSFRLLAGKTSGLQLGLSAGRLAALRKAGRAAAKLTITGTKPGFAPSQTIVRLTLLPPASQGGGIGITGSGSGGSGSGNSGGGTGGTGGGPPAVNSASIAQVAARLILDFDPNGDGRVVLDETWSGRNLLRFAGVEQLDATSAQPFVARYDADRNGQITKAESDAMYADIHAHDPPPPGMMPPARLTEVTSSLMMRFDRNGDGVVTAADGAGASELLTWQGMSAMDRAAMQTFASNYDADRDTWLVDPEQSALTADVNSHAPDG